MKGPAIFLLSLAGAAVVGAVLLRPALEERGRLREDVEVLAGADHVTPAAVAQARDRLSGELGPCHGEPARVLLREIAARFALESSPAVDDGELSFTTGIDRLSTLLSALEAAAGALDAIHVTSVDRTDRCRVRLVLAAGDR